MSYDYCKHSECFFALCGSVVGVHTLKLGIWSTLAVLMMSTFVAWKITIFSWDVEFTKWIQGFSLGDASFLRSWIFWMGVHGVAGLVMAIVFLALWFKAWRLEAVFLGFISIPDLLNVWLRSVIGRPRPTSDLVDVVIGYGGIQGNGFPSGHALHVVLFYGFLMYLAIVYMPNLRLARAICAVMVMYILATGLWLIYDGRHWLTGVMGGYLYGGWYLMCLISAYRWTKEWISDEHSKLFSLLPTSVKKATSYLLRLLA